MTKMTGLPAMTESAGTANRCCRAPFNAHNAAASNRPRRDFAPASIELAVYECARLVADAHRLSHRIRHGFDRRFPAWLVVRRTRKSPLAVRVRNIRPAPDRARRIHIPNGISAGGLVLREDVRAGESLLEAFSEVFFTRQVDQGPVCGADTDDAPGPDAFDDLVRLKTNLNAAAA